MNFVPLVEPARAEPKLKAYQRPTGRRSKARSRRWSRRKTLRRAAAWTTLRTELTRLKRPSLPPGPRRAATPSPRASRPTPRSSGGATRQSGPVVPRGVPGSRSWTASRRRRFRRRAAAGSSWPLADPARQSPDAPG